MGNAIPKPTCHVKYNDLDGCNSDDACYYLDNRCRDKLEFYPLTDVDIDDIKCSIYPDTTRSNNYILFCINQNFSGRNIAIKSIQLINCNSLYRSDCNILIPLNIENNEFAIKPYMQTFNFIDGRLTQTINLTLDQVNLIKRNNNIITIIDVYDEAVMVNVEMYDTHYEEVLRIDQDMFNLNVDNINKTSANLKGLGLNNLMII